MRTAFLSFVLLLVFVTAAAAATAPHTASLVSKPQSSSPLGKAANLGFLTATGEGAMPTVQEQPNRAKAYLQAKGYAQAKAVANLIQAARGTSITYVGNGRNYAMDERINQEISGMLDSVTVVSERRVQIGKDTVVQVTVQAPIPERWQNTPAAKRVAAAAAAPTWSVASADSAIPTPAAFRKAKEAPYTSVIIDTLGMGVVRSMSPKILRTDGSEVWGTVKVDYDFVADYGIVAYARTLGEAYANPRAGSNPLVLRALRRGPSAFKCDVVLSDDDADYLLAENARAGFLKEFRVIFLVDAAR